MSKTQYIECRRKTDKNGNCYHTEKWEDVEYDNKTLQFKHTTVFSGRCSKQIFDERMNRSKFIEKSKDFIMFEN